MYKVSLESRLAFVPNRQVRCQRTSKVKSNKALWFLLMLSLRMFTLGTQLLPVRKLQLGQRDPMDTPVWRGTEAPMPASATQHASERTFK